MNSTSAGDKGRTGIRNTPPTPLGVKGGCISPSDRFTVQGHGIETIKKLCRDLSPSQRKEVRDYITYLDKEEKQNLLASSRTGQSLSRDEEMLADSLEQSLAEALGTPRQAHNRPAAILGSLRDCYAIVEAFVQATGLSRSKSYERKALYNMLAGMLVDYSRQLATKIGAPLSFKFVLQNSAKMPALFDLAYPGYAASGLAGIVADRLLQHQPKE